jgi:hypothetical protein
MWALSRMAEGPAALVMGRFFIRLKNVFNIDKHTRAFPVSSSTSAPASGIIGGRLAKVFSPTIE